MSIFSERLTNARELKHWTRKRAVAEFGIPYQTYSNYENGKREPDVGTIAKMAKALDTTADYLLGATDDPSPRSSNLSSTDLADMLDNAHSYDGKPMDDHDRALVEQFLVALFSQRDKK